MAASSVGSLRWVIGLPIFIAFTCCLALNAASQLLEDSDATLAATLNPLNTDARVNVLVERLNAGATPLDLLAGEAHALVTLSSADARGYSLVGAIEERRGDIAAASASYSAALDHSRTERYALTRLLSLSLADGDIVSATRYFDLLLRRWGEFSKDIAPLVHDIAAQPEGAQALKVALEQDPPWRSAVVRELLAGSDGVRFVADLLASARQRGDVWRDDLATTINRMINLAAGAEAYALFQGTLSPEEEALVGYVFDPGLSRPGVRRSFDWSSVDSTSMADVSLPASSLSPGLRLRFLDSPAKLGRPAQVLFLPPGSYILSTTASGEALVAPRGLFWQVRCLNRGLEIARLDLSVGTYKSQTHTAAFNVPDDCALQRLTLETGVTTSSWRDRYGGEVLITDVHVSRAGAAT